MNTIEKADVTFRTGPYGEVYPLPLTGGVEPAEALETLTGDSAALGSPVDVPSRGKSLEGMLNLGVLYVHQQRLRDAMAGALDLPEARALRKAVMDDRRPMSLRPLMMEHVTYGFAPILAYLGGGRWRVGRGGESTAFEEPDPARAVAKAQRIFKAWADSDDERWQQGADRALERFPRSLFHDYWAHLSRHTPVWDRGAGFSLRLLGRHNTFELETPGGRRVFTTSPVRAAHLCDALARWSGSAPRYPSSTEVMEWLNGEGVPIPAMEGRSVWRLGCVEAQELSEKHVIVLKAAGGYFVIRKEGRRRAELVLRPLKGGRPDRSRTLAHTAVEPPLGDWMRDLGRTVLTMWFVWKAGLGAE